MMVTAVEMRGFKSQPGCDDVRDQAQPIGVGQDSGERDQAAIACVVRRLRRNHPTCQQMCYRSHFFKWSLLTSSSTMISSMSSVEQQIARRRTFAIISHPDAGKTTLTEKFLLYGGAVQLAGSVTARKNQRA